MATDKEDEKDGKQTDFLEAIETDESGKPVGQQAADEGSGEDSRISPDAAEAAEAEDNTPHADPEQEKLRLERKLRRKIQKDIQREQRAKERNELAELRRQNEELLNRMKSLEASQAGTAETTLKSQLRNAVAVYNEATEELRLAVEAGDGKRHVEALEKRDRAKETAQALDVQLRRLQEKPAEKPIGPDPQEARLYQEWIAKNTWFDTNLGNDESKMARVVNDALLAEGYRPNTPAFWNELSARVERFVKPTRAKPREGDEGDEDDKPPQRRGGPPVAGSGREAPSPGKGRVYITPERKQAMIEAGVWHDEARRQQYLRAYEKFDRENAQRAN